MAFRNEDHSDLSLFKNRLFNLMIEKRITTSRQLATVLLDNNLIKINSKVEMDKYDRRKKNIDAIEQRVSEHLKSDEPSKLQAEYALAYSKLFSCSIDYLFGVSSVKSIDPNIKCCSEYLNLNEDAIMKLKKCSIYLTTPHKNIKKRNTLESFINSPNFMWLILDFANLDILYNKYKDEEISIANELNKKYSSDVLNRAYKLLDKIEDLDPEKKLLPYETEEVIEVYNAILSNEDKLYANEVNYETQLKIAKYELNEKFILMINEFITK